VSHLLEHADATEGYVGAPTDSLSEITEDTAVTPAEALVAAAHAAGLAVLAAAQWPETPTDEEPPPVPGFVVSAFNPLVAVVAERCLRRRPHTGPDGSTPVTAVVLVSARGDLTSAAHVAATLDAGRKVAPLLFFQSVPNAIAGHVAARWSLTGPVVCVAALDAGLAIAELLIADGDTELALVVRVELTDTAVETPDLAVAVLVGGGDTGHGDEGEPQ
jgi:hypothetical protein